MSEKNNDKKQSARGSICLLPNLLTTLSLFSGFYSIVSSINGQFLHAAVAILVAGVFDGLDGRVARMTGTTSKFGEEYDSLCDLVSFGVAPAMLAYLWVLQPYGRYGWLAAFLYVATTALRLARFNSMIEETPKNVFVGLPCPAAAGMIATSVLFCRFVSTSEAYRDLVMLIMVYGLSYLMVSTHHYSSFKQVSKTKFQFLVGMVLLLMVIATEPQVTLFLLGVTYVLSGPLAGVYQVLACRKNKDKHGKHKHKAEESVIETPSCLEEKK
ncbi:MAG: CDP-diacylglycerol--serine O-phosphatidyltransferase [Desulfobulbaceae bacterium]|uniref:CDP-diacylglycerol--serine O-phosphatidyltransferase n=1 Tax=Candidatus Desulfobia pelagia TaxID=2841692 RepID=A0A8J6NDZ7_9BACT|nr:CDP-diacylglycerol--serine O-phosphatidyltransferase [Candidatus Desulfobia pelagia]